MSHANECRPRDGTDDVLSPRVEGRPAGVGVEDGSHPNQATGSQLPAGFANGFDGVGRRHRDFNGDDPSRDERFRQRQHLVAGLGADHGDDTGIRQPLNDVSFGGHELQRRHGRYSALGYEPSTLTK